MYSLDQELAFATQKVREQRAVIATLQSELAAAKESRDRESVAYDKLNNAFIDLNLDCDKLKEERDRAREALIDAWAYAEKDEDTWMHVCQSSAEARYTREIAKEE